MLVGKLAGNAALCYYHFLPLAVAFDIIQITRRFVIEETLATQVVCLA
jgi:hypothetical protein